MNSLSVIATVLEVTWVIWVLVFIRFVLTRRYYLMPTFSPSVRFMMTKKKDQEAETCIYGHIGVYENSVRCDRATRKAADLLWSHLNNGQRNQVVREQAFTVYTPRGRFRFGLGLTTHYATPKGAWRHACIHPCNAQNLPSPDRILALKLLAEADPDQFLRIAVITPR